MLGLKGQRLPNAKELRYDKSNNRSVATAPESRENLPCLKKDSF